MPKDSLPPEVHRVKARLADGSCMYYFSLRGRKGTGFYKSRHRLPGEREFHTAYVSALDAAAPKKSGFSTSDLVDDYLSSPRYHRLKPRTKEDYSMWLSRFTSEFGDDPAVMFEEWESKVEVNEWRDAWKSSPKQFDYAGAVVTMLLNWGAGKGRIRNHYCSFEKIYKADRAHITWTQEFIDRFLKVAPESVGRVLIAATETGLRPADLVKLRMSDVQYLNSGNRRLRIATNKRGVFAHIPITPKMAQLIDTVPEGQDYLLVNASGNPWTARYASQRISHWKNKAGLTEAALGYSLHMHDCRGTATTRLLEAAADAVQLATVFGWNLRYATQMVEVYAVVGGDKTDKILELVAKAEKNTSGT
ncbi:tyrosine-type recombinase/integrase [Halocynthiibacter styelae]|uniref:Tyrosine-type recombinase/integrase n=1 Tax=Halocynthiibacter styelae TaxID=2761955 RepID=A0A8J7IVY0_9RHOB|nr:tyrosine-type recombinase/integrase [Paenihalocynthiibacter styelae]MBI1492685.1 tyrosine-type recombinase/integrase [Paenihalocynthiibacter styelae]